MEEKRVSGGCSFSKEDEEEAITELLRRFDPLIMVFTSHIIFISRTICAEARIVMLRAVHKYDENHAVSFAGYYQRCLKESGRWSARAEHRQRLASHELVVRGERLAALQWPCERRVLLHEKKRRILCYLSL